MSEGLRQKATKGVVWSAVQKYSVFCFGCCFGPTAYVIRFRMHRDVGHFYAAV